MIRLVDTNNHDTIKIVLNKDNEEEDDDDHDGDDKLKS